MGNAPAQHMDEPEVTAIASQHTDVAVAEAVTAREERCDRNVLSVALHQRFSPETDIGMWTRHSAARFIIEVAFDNRIHPETQWMAIDYLDHYLSSTDTLVLRDHWSAVSLACLNLASKFVEPNSGPHVTDLLEACSFDFTVEEIVCAESSVLTNLNWRLVVPTPNALLPEDMSDQPGLKRRAHLFVLLSAFGMRALILPHHSLSVTLSPLPPARPPDLRLLHLPVEIIAGASILCASSVDTANLDTLTLIIAEDELARVGKDLDVNQARA